ncbi:MAG TPA: endolytic transglycosylase MltG [Actinomycetota bacterium]|nr:endolytic transglycosylase MltG [Actinomycetota bacterium]
MRKFLGFLVVMGLIAAGAAFFVWNWAQGPEVAGGEPVDVTIEQGSSATQIADTLQEAKVVDSALAFRMYMRFNDINADLRAGKYRLETAQPFDSLIAELRKGPPAEFVRLTIPEGLNVEQTAVVVGEKTHISAADFLAAAVPATARPTILPPNSNTLEGFFYPTTYFVEEKETAQTLVARMVAEFHKATEDSDLGATNDTGRTPYEILVIASLIEEEAKSAEERDDISAVIHNRLKANMALGIDATIQYAVKKYEGQPLTVSDLAIDSPFNSRTRVGLPPNPIASPRKASIEAALNPADSDAIYYVLSGDCVHHVFTADYNRFLAAKNNQPRNC